ncbi:CDP-diacylglycerol--serine O-phosphatidyltransferase [Fonticella tunisiensis]|uniref:CDP-diacylglycerol--serine O-phosphatidyltransferase n=1 Tax=Fonticella tunisiensis TaxID=1096341 RepID=A0A4R7KP62_9CLOT|nr:CDP-diacylglycerol--serine O-phosphatidyltransferase [Fonticella tunisiensis]TDT60891.1 CDP-diacylglycerol--serine O-phosphatidyltransferase [Fonticella tunisiensis]
MRRSMIPNFLTFLNLSFGMLSILLTLTDKPNMAALMIVCAALVDRYDGRIARLFNAESPLGKELDSLADLVSFGAAPAVLTWNTFLKNFGIIGYIIAIIFPISGAFRLARYNVTKFENVFTGVPITMAGSLMAFDNLIAYYYKEHSIVSIAFMLILSCLMVSKLKVKKI